MEFNKVYCSQHLSHSHFYNASQSQFSQQVLVDFSLSVLCKFGDGGGGGGVICKMIFL